MCKIKQSIKTDQHFHPHLLIQIENIPIQNTVYYQYFSNDFFLDPYQLQHVFKNFSIEGPIELEQSSHLSQPQSLTIPLTSLEIVNESIQFEVPFHLRYPAPERQIGSGYRQLKLKNGKLLQNEIQINCHHTENELQITVPVAQVSDLEFQLVQLFTLSLFIFSFIRLYYKLNH